MAILETEKVMNDIISISETVYGLYFWQLDYAFDLKKKERDHVESQVFLQNMPAVMFLKNLGLPVFGSRATWNPLCGGTIFSYISFFGNLEGGCALIDGRAQLRITLHHALRVNSIVREGEIELLDRLYDAFKTSRAIWEGPLPRKGEFLERFWVCFGSSRADAKKLAEKARQEIQSGAIRRDVNDMIRTDLQ
mmetsp:Transcript_10333/g.18281  ORF Transcript_10333/g.18281 Transcript_10333/m.18281 type:complete len:193 (+) Transcript_10333:3-581(+)